ncbi:RNA 2',3'-cyclic phosphodiesterase [Candidatus Woesearchaeota archaeon]|nr:RNA 2',3'-cyclic phosphodiesterase [Candidatus Woesearchaeota archaeon]
MLMRLFIAIDFNELKDYFLVLQQLLPKNAGLSLVNSFHLTLKFLGDVQPEDVDSIISSLKKIDFRPSSVFLDSVGIFPSENYIRVVWVGLKPEGTILELQKSIDEALKPLFKKEKEFKAHVTLARVKYPQDKKRFLEELKKIKVENKKIEVRDFRLVKSALGPKGAVYDDLAVFSSNSPIRLCPKSHYFSKK